MFYIILLWWVESYMPSRSIDRATGNERILVPYRSPDDAEWYTELGVSFYSPPIPAKQCRESCRTPHCKDIIGIRWIVRPRLVYLVSEHTTVVSVYEFGRENPYLSPVEHSDHGDHTLAFFKQTFDRTDYSRVDRYLFPSVKE